MSNGEQVVWITPKQAAEIMDVALPTVHRLCREGVIHCERFGEKLWKVSEFSARAYEKTEGGRGKKAPKTNQ